MKKLKIKLEHEKAKLPKKAHPTDAGYDLYAASRQDKLAQIVYDTGVAMAIPEGKVGLLFPRSSVVKSTLRLANCVGVLDSSYRGTIKFCFDVLNMDQLYKVGDRIGQLVVVDLSELELEEVKSLDDTERGVGGFGSTGE